MNDYHHHDGSDHQQHMPEERRKIQRDWLGHALQASAVVVLLLSVLGVPLLIWGSGVNAMVAVLQAREDRTERDLVDVKAAEQSRVAQESQFVQQLAGMAAEVKGLRDDLQHGRK